MRTAKTLIRLGGGPGRSESSLGAHSFCWFCHVAAHLSIPGKILANIRLNRLNEHPDQTGLLPESQCGVQEGQRNNRHDLYSKATPREMSRTKCGPLYEPRHDKTNKMRVRPEKTQISLGIRPVRSEFSLSA